MRSSTRSGVNDAMASAMCWSSGFAREMAARCFAVASAMSAARSAVNDPSVSTYTAAPSSPPKDTGICVDAHSCMHICVLPIPGHPHSSVISPTATPPPSRSSSSWQNV